MDIPLEDIDYEAILSFSLKASTDNSIKKAEYVKDPEEVSKKRKLFRSYEDEKVYQS